MKLIGRCCSDFPPYRSLLNNNLGVSQAHALHVNPKSTCVVPQPISEAVSGNLDRERISDLFLHSSLVLHLEIMA